MKQKHYIDQFSDGAILPLIIKMAIPFTLAQIVNALYSIVDRFFIARIPEIGTVALSGLGITFPVIILINAFAALIGSGGAPLASIRWGSGDSEGTKRLVGNSFTLLLLFGGLLMVGCYAWKDALLLAFGASSQSLPYAIEYLNVYLMGTIFVMISLGMNQFISSQGFARTSTATTVIGALLNIILDPIFIYGLNLGIKGAAYATVISQMVSSAWVLLFLFSKKPIWPIQPQYLAVKWSEFVAIVKLGISTASFSINECLATILINLLLVKWGGADRDIYIAAMTIVGSVTQVFYMPLTGIVRAAQPIIGHNMGRKDMPRIREALKITRICCLTLSFSFWAVMMTCAGTIASIFTPDPALATIAATALRCTYATIFVIGMQMSNQHAFIAMGSAKLSFIFGMLRKVCLVLPLTAILPCFVGIYGIFLAESVGNVIAVVITYIVFERYANSVAQRFQSPSAP